MKHAVVAFGLMLLASPAFAQTVDQATLDKAWAACSKTADRGGPMLAPDGHQERKSQGPGAKFSRWVSPDWDEICEPVFQEHLARETARKAADENTNPDLRAARDAARALGAIK